MYGWEMDEVATTVASKDRQVDALSLINVVPNPYYAFSTYEKNRLDTKVKITNLPENCVIKIYNISGKLIRTFKKASQLSFVDWDLKNNQSIPIASGVYLIHVEVEGVGSTVIKFFGGMRQIDLETI
jgi:FAD synthase